MFQLRNLRIRYAVSEENKHLDRISYILLPAGKDASEVMPAFASVVFNARMVVCCLACSFMVLRTFLRSTALSLYVTIVALPALALVCRISTMANFFAAGRLFFIFHFRM